MAFPTVFRPVAQASGKLADRLLCVGGAALFCQLPEFMQQYLQRLEGHLDEATFQLAQFRQAALRSGTTLDQFISNTAGNPDPAVGRMGTVIRALVSRVDHLTEADLALRHATALTRPFVFLAHLDPVIARAAWSIYRPAMPTTLEGAIYAVAGMAAALAVFHGCARMAFRIAKFRQKGH